MLIVNVRNKSWVKSEHLVLLSNDPGKIVATELCTSVTNVHPVKVPIEFDKGSSLDTCSELRILVTIDLEPERLVKGNEIAWKIRFEIRRLIGINYSIAVYILLTEGGVCISQSGDDE